MGTEARTLGRRRLLLLVGSAAVYPACRGRGATLGCGGELLVDPGAGDASAEASIDAATGGGPGERDAAADGAGDRRDAGGVADGAAGDSASGDVDSGSAIDSGPGLTDSGDVDAVGGDGGCVVNSNVLVVPLSSYPALQRVGGSVILDAQGYTDPQCGRNKIIVIRTAQDAYVALSESCTHDCCELNFTGTNLACACDGGMFDLQGNVIGGPPQTPLPVLATCWDEKAVYVSLA